MNLVISEDNFEHVCRTRDQISLLNKLVAAGDPEVRVSTDELCSLLAPMIDALEKACAGARPLAEGGRYRCWVVEQGS